MIVQVDGGERGNINHEFNFPGHLAGEPVVERVDALDEDRLVAASAQRMRLFAALALNKIELRRFNFFALQQRYQVLAQQFQIQRIRIFQIALAVFVHGNGIAIEIIIVQRNFHGQMPHGSQQDGEPVRHRGLARRGWPRHQDQPRAAGEEFLRDVHQGNLVQFLVDADEFAQRALFDHFVEIGHVGDAQDLVPARAFGKGAHQLGQFHQPAGARGIRPVGQQQRQARQQQAQIEHRHIARGGNHFPIEVFRHAVALVELEVLIGPVVQKAHFVHIAACT